MPEPRTIEDIRAVLTALREQEETWHVGGGRTVPAEKLSEALDIADTLMRALELAAKQLQNAHTGCLPSDKAKCSYWQRTECYSNEEPCSTCDAYASTQSEWVNWAIAQASAEPRSAQEQGGGE